MNIQILLQHWAKQGEHPGCLKKYVRCIYVKPDGKFTILLTEAGAEELGTEKLAQQFYQEAPRWLEGRLENEQRGRLENEQRRLI